MLGPPSVASVLVAVRSPETMCVGLAYSKSHSYAGQWRIQELTDVGGGGGVIDFGYSGVRPLLWHSDFKETNVSSQLTRKDLIL